MSRNLNDLHPYVKYLCEQFLEKCKAAGLHPTITSTLRTNQEQADIYASGRTKPGPVLSYTKAGYSMHNYGLAFDCSFPATEYAKAAAIGKALGLTWGGDFVVNGKPFIDRPHFQWTGGLTTAQLLAGKRPENPLKKDKHKEIVKKFQHLTGLVEDGIDGPITEAKAREVLEMIKEILGKV